VRPLGKAGRKPRHCIPTGTFTMSRRSRGGNVRAGLTPSLRACRARPSRGASQGETASRGKPGANAEGGFLGGTHSVRPRCEAVPMPRHDMISGGKRSPERLMGRSPGGSKASFAGVQSPPLRGEAGALRMA